MSSNSDEYVSRMLNINETTLDFLSKSGVGGWPTILGIFGIMVMTPESHKWLEKSKINELPKPEIGDNLYWYKLKYNLKTNIRKSVPESLLKGVNAFTDKDIPEPISSTNKIIVSKNVVYFFTQNGIKACNKTETDLKKCKSLPISGIIDVLSKDDADYILTPSNVYKLNTSDFTTSLILGNRGTLNAFCLANDILIVAASSNTNSILGGYRIDIGSNNITEIIYKETNTMVNLPTDPDAPSDTPPAQVSVTFTNGIPKNGGCCYCWFDGLKYYIGNYTTSGYFDPSDTSFDVQIPIGAIEDSHPSFISNGINRHHNGIGYVNKSGLLYGQQIYSVSGVKSILELDDFMLFGTDSGIKVFSKSPIDGDYGTDKEYMALSGIAESVEGLCLLYGTLFVISQTKKYRSFDSEEDGNKFRLIVFGTDYDVDVEADETDAKEVKLTLIELLDIGSNNSKVFDSKLSKAKLRKAEYAIAINDVKPRTISLYGHDNRNASAMELNSCMKSFDMEIK